MTAIAVMIVNKNGRMKMSSDKQLILIILVGAVILIYQYIKDEKKKHDEKLQRHLSKYFDSKW